MTMIMVMLRMIMMTMRLPGDECEECRNEYDDDESDDDDYDYDDNEIAW